MIVRVLHRLLAGRVWRHPFVTARATRPEGCQLHVLPALGAASVEHVLKVPRGACPVSGNPRSGRLRVQYRPGAVVLEIVSLEVLLQRAAREHPPLARSIEELARLLHAETRLALGVAVQVELDLIVEPGPQRYRVSFDG